MAKNPDSPRHWVQVVTQITNMTGSVAGSICLFSWLGYQAGKRWGHMSALIVLGFTVGLIGAGLSLGRFIKNHKDD